MVGLGAVTNITFNGNSVAVDSWNSHDPTQSTNGLFNGYSGTNGSVGLEFGEADLGNHTILGNLYLGPTATWDDNGTVTGTVYNDWNVSFPDVALPTTDTNGFGIVWMPAPLNGTNGNTYHDFSTSGYYVLNDSYTVTVEPGVKVHLNVQQRDWSPTAININGGTTNSGTAKLYLNPSTAPSSVTMAGNSNGGASGNRPENLWVYGMNNVTSITYSGTSAFVGVIYAPKAKLTLNGGGNNVNFIGAAIINSVTLNGHYNFHYDTSLGTNATVNGYVVTGWQEL
jgi:hypothetical protein